MFESNLTKIWFLWLTKSLLHRFAIRTLCVRREALLSKPAIFNVNGEGYPYKSYFMWIWWLQKWGNDKCIFLCFLGFFVSSKSTRQGRRSHQKTPKELKSSAEGNFLSFRHKSFPHLQEVKSSMLNSIRMRLEIIYIFFWMRPVCLV